MKKLVWLLLFVVFRSSQVEADELLEEEKAFLETMFQKPIDEVIKIAENFTLSTKDQSDHVSLLMHERFSESEPRDITNVKYELKPNEAFVVIIHGWQDHGRAPWIKHMASNYYQTYPNLRVLSLDWQSLAALDYVSSAAVTRSVGISLAGFLLNGIIVRYKKAYINSLHIVGHGLGAHIGGFTSHALQVFNKGGIGRVTGLDPAGPLFTTPILQPTPYRLDKDDSIYVDFYHTNIKQLGQTISSGKADIFFNCGGPIQPICEVHGDIMQRAFCSSEMAHEYFADTILNRTMYRAQENSGTNTMNVGQFIHQPASGEFFASTDDVTLSKD